MCNNKNDYCQYFMNPFFILSFILVIALIIFAVIYFLYLKSKNNILKNKMLIDCINETISNLELNVNMPYDIETIYYINKNKELVVKVMANNKKAK